MVKQGATEITVTDNSFTMHAGDVNLEEWFGSNPCQIKLSKSDEYFISIFNNLGDSYKSSLDTVTNSGVYVKVELITDAIVINSVCFEGYKSAPLVANGNQVWYGLVLLDTPETLTVKVDWSYAARHLHRRQSERR